MLDTATDWLGVLGRASLFLAVSAMVTQGLMLLLRPHSPRIRQLAWTIVLVQGFVVWHFNVPVARLAATNGPHSAPVLADDRIAAAIPVRSQDPVTPNTALLDRPSARAVSAEIAAPVASHAAVDWGTGLLLLWICGFTLCAARWLHGYLRMVRAVRQATAAPSAWLQEWHELCRECGLALRVTFLVSKDWGPAVCRVPGGYRIVVPAAAWQRLERNERRAILRHELEHLCRGDAWRLLLFRIMALPHWFNPMAWWAVAKLDECAEWSCDEVASQLSPGGREYARALMRLGSERRPAPGAAAARGGRLFERIKRVLSQPSAKESTMKKPILMIVVLLCMAANLVRFVPPAVAQDDRPNRSAALSDLSSQTIDDGPQDVKFDDPTKSEPKSHRVTIETAGEAGFILKGSKESVEKIARLLEKLGKQPPAVENDIKQVGGKAELTIYYLKHVKAELATETIEKLWPTRQQSVQISAEPRLNAVLVHAPPKETREIDDLLKKLDSNVPGTLPAKRGPAPASAVPAAHSAMLDPIALANSVSEALGVIDQSKRELSQMAETRAPARAAQLESKIQGAERRLALLKRMIEVAIHGAERELQVVTQELDMAKLLYESGQRELISLTTIQRSKAQVTSYLELLNTIHGEIKR